MTEHIDYILRYGGRCRDCADADGFCERDGTPCDPAIHRPILKHALEALAYGIKHGYIENPFPKKEQEVFVVMADDNMASWIVGVYPTEEKAKEAVEADRKRYVKGGGGINIYNFEIKKEILKPEET